MRRHDEVGRMAAAALFNLFPEIPAFAGMTVWAGPAQAQIFGAGSGNRTRASSLGS